MAQIIANENAKPYQTNIEPILTKAGDLAAIDQFKENDVLFIDEIHRLAPNIEEILYPAMEDYQIDILIGEGPSARSIKLDLPKFTLLAQPHALVPDIPIERPFWHHNSAEYYPESDLATIISRSAAILGITIETQAATFLASRSRGTPRLANRLLRRIRDYAIKQ